MDVNGMDLNSANGKVQSLSPAAPPGLANKQVGGLVASKNAETVSNKTVNTQDKNVNKQDDVDKMLSSLNEQLKKNGTYLKFEKSEDNHKMVFFIKNSSTDETIRQIPSKELMAISKNISSYLDRLQKESPGLSGEKASPLGLITSQKV